MGFICHSFWSLWEEEGEEGGKGGGGGCVCVWVCSRSGFVCSVEGGGID